VFAVRLILFFFAVGSTKEILQQARSPLLGAIPVPPVGLYFLIVRADEKLNWKHLLGGL